MTQTMPAGWYPDTENPGGQRYWDGNAWTENRLDANGGAAGTTVAVTPKAGMSKGKKIGIGVGALVVVFVIIAAMSGGSKDTPAASSPTTPTASESSTPSADATTPEATPTETPEPSETAAAISKPVTYRGSGNKVLKISKPETGIMLITTTIKGPSDNNTVYALDSDLKEGDLLVNTIGSYRGTTLLDTGDTETTRLKIDVSGTWVITLSSIATAREITTTAKGSKDDVLVYRGDSPAIMTFKSTSGDSNVTAYWLTGAGNDLLVNEIGKFSTEAPMSAGPGLLTVSSDGAWNISIAPA